MNEKYKNLLDLIWLKDYHQEETIAYMVLLKYFLTEQFLDFFQEKSNEKPKAYISVLIQSNPDFSNFKDWLTTLASNFVLKTENQNFSYEKVKQFIEKINNFKEDELKDFYDYFLEVILKNPLKSWILSSPKDINILAKNILNPEKWSFYSTTFWIWKNFIENFSNIWNFSFSWQEINSTTFLLSKVYLKINYIKWDIRLWGFKEDLFTWQTFDYSFSIPPFWLKDESIDWDWDYFFINKVLDHLDKKWKWAIVLPFSSTFKKRKILIEERKNIIRNWFLESIILLPNKSFKPYTSIDTVLWVFNKSKNNNEILFIDWRFSSIEKILNAFNSNKEIENLSKFWSYEEIEKYDFNLNPWIYVNWIEEEIKILEDSRKIWKWLQKFIDIDVPKENSKWMPQKAQELIKKWKRDWKISQDDVIEAFPNFEDDLELLDEFYTKIFKLWIEITDNWSKKLFWNQDNNDTPNEKIENSKKEIFTGSYKKVEMENNEFQEEKEESENLKEVKKQENLQKSKNLNNITALNDKIHEDIIQFSEKFEIYPLDSKDEIWKKWNKRTKDSMRLANIISLNSYIYNNDEKDKVKSQFDLVKYFDEQLENEWKLETRKNYANRLFWFLIIETIVLFFAIWYLFNKLSLDDLIKFSDLLKWGFWLTLWQITLMVWAIVKYLFPSDAKITDNPKKVQE